MLRFDNNIGKTNSTHACLYYSDNAYSFDYLYYTTKFE